LASGTEWPEFVFVTTAHGSGWVPARCVSASSGSAVARTAYGTTEFSTRVGDVLEVVAEDLISGWLWCRSRDGRERLGADQDPRHRELSISSVTRVRILTGALRDRPRQRHLALCEALDMANEVVDIAEKLSLFSEHWTPKVVARLNDYEVKVVKLGGEFVWHTHENTDELFLVVDGELTIQLRDADVTLKAGQLFVVPRGVEHCPVASGEVHALLIEPTGVVNTGDAGGALTAAYDDSLA
jgi:mannose-6-phosphate isomerase-like protein (cupin superfamily)